MAKIERLISLANHLHFLSCLPVLYVNVIFDSSLFFVLLHHTSGQDSC